MQVQTSELVGYRGDLKQYSNVHSPFFPPKKGEKTEKCQRGLKTAKYLAKLVTQIQNFIYFTGLKWSKWVKPNNIGQKSGKKGFN